MKAKRQIRKSAKVVKTDLADRVISLVEEARKKVATAANVALVYTYYEVGRMIVEDEQGGKKRAAYGKSQLATLSRKLTERFGRGWSSTNLEYMRKFFKVYSVPSGETRSIPQTGFEESMRDSARKSANELRKLDTSKDLVDIVSPIQRFCLTDAVRGCFCRAS